MPTLEYIYTVSDPLVCASQVRKWVTVAYEGYTTDEEQVFLLAIPAKF